MLRRLAVWTCVTACASCSGRSALDVALFDAGTDAALPEDDAGPAPIPRADKIDLLLVIDNSRSIADAHDLLARSLPYLFQRIAEPACVNGLGNVVATTPSPSDPCPVGEREFAPIRDVHVGVVSTSLGGHGADVCSPGYPSFLPEQNDQAHLLSRAPGGGSVPTWAGKGFLSWDPQHQQSPPGDDDPGALASKLGEMVRGVTTSGCGFESQLESIYRFLVDPEPYASIQIENGGAIPTGLDTVLLQQRADFLRRDSAVVVVLLTDENDCSTRDGGQYYLSLQAFVPGGMPFHLPRARSICATDPSNPCCASCAQPTPQGCPPTSIDPSCQLPPLNDLEDPLNLRCFDQKRRFGIDFLQPIERYVAAFSETAIETRDGVVVPNPLLEGRPKELVFFAGIVGVPWQDIAFDPMTLASGFEPATQIQWSWLLGEGDEPPGDPLMHESIAPRSGANPATGAPLAPPGSPLLANPINGHERTIALQDELQYACIYPLPAPKDCSGDVPDCECGDDAYDGNPLCQQPDGTYAKVQRFARALPSIRPLQVLSRLGEQAVVASICAEVVNDETSPSFGYKPAIDAILRTLRPRLAR